MVSARVSTTAEILKLFFRGEKQWRSKRILRNKTCQDFSENWWLFLIKQLFHLRLLDMR